MSFESLRYLVGATHRLFFLAAMFAVLWTKGYLWSLFGVALGLYVISALTMHVLMDLARNARLERAAADEDDEDDYPPLPPTKPFRARTE